MENYVLSNQAEMIGFAEGEPVFSHELFGEKFYTFTLRIPRLSGISDYIRVMASDRLMTDFKVEKDKEIEVIGQFRSYNNYIEGKQACPDCVCKGFESPGRGGK